MRLIPSNGAFFDLIFSNIRRFIRPNIASREKIVDGVESIKKWVYLKAGLAQAQSRRPGENDAFFVHFSRRHARREMQVEIKMRTCYPEFVEYNGRRPVKFNNRLSQQSFVGVKKLVKALA